MKVVSGEVIMSNDDNNTPIPSNIIESKHRQIRQTRSCKLSLDCFGQFKDSALQEEYISYCVHQKSSISYISFTFLIIGWAIAETIGRARYSARESPHFITLYVLINAIFTFLAIMCCFLSICYSQHCFHQHHHHQHATHRQSIDDEIIPIPPKQKTHHCSLLIVSYLQVGLILSITMVFAIKLYGQTAFPACIIENHELLLTIENRFIPLIGLQNTTEFFHQELLPYFCPSTSSVASTSSLTINFLMGLCPQILMALLHEPRLYLVLLCHVTISCLMLFGMSVSVFSFFSLLSLFLGIGILFVNFHYQNAKSFLQYRMLEELFEKNEENSEEADHVTIMRQMIGNVAHDLKTPLASFVTGLDMIQDLLQSSKEKIRNHEFHPDTFDQCIGSIQAYLSNIYNTNAFMLMTINRCIDYTKASKGMKLVPKYETVDLREALQFPIECMSNIQERIGIKLEPLSKDICSHIITDKQWLQENLLCLLSNAVKYSAEGEVSIKASILTHSSSSEYAGNVLSSTHKRRYHRSIDSLTELPFHPFGLNTATKDTLSSELDHLLFEVEDHGIGMSEEKMVDLFNPFNQAQRLAGGTGLGLFSLAKRIEALNGNYGVKKRGDGKQGSLFWFTIPYRADPLSADPKEFNTEITERVSSQSTSNTACNPFMNGKLEILLVDDSPSILKMSSMMLKRQGHQIWTAENGEIALKRIEEKWKESGRGFDLVLMDLQMPVMDGLEATRRLRKMESEGRDWMSLSNQSFPYSHEVILGVSANSDHDTMKEALDAGVNDFIGKPFSIDLFNSIIRNHLCISPF